jgi:hypothetical protein
MTCKVCWCGRGTDLLHRTLKRRNTACHLNKVKEWPRISHAYPDPLPYFVLTQRRVENCACCTACTCTMYAEMWRPCICMCLTVLLTCSGFNHEVSRGCCCLWQEDVSRPMMGSWAFTKCCYSLRISDRTRQVIGQGTQVQMRSRSGLCFHVNVPRCMAAI